MNASPISGNDVEAAPLQDNLGLLQLETAARYLFVASLPVPAIIIGLAAVLTHWFAIVPLMLWVVPTLFAWFVRSVVLYRFLHDENRARHQRQWTAALCLSIVLAMCALGAVAPLFWVDHDRINNLMFYVFLAGGLASAGGQSAPSFTLAIANLTPYAILFVAMTLIHEAAPMSFELAALECAYIGIVAMYMKSVHQMAREMLVLREERHTLIGKLRDALVDATAARCRAETASRAKSQFLANMSHELRTPLNAVLGFSEVIRDRLFGDAAVLRYADYAASIHASGSHLLGLINDVLDLSKIEAGKLELSPERFDFVAEASEAFRLVEPQAARKDISLMRDSPDALEIVADRRALRQIAVNLLSNAIKFTPSGGAVTLVLGCNDKGCFVMAVRDTGIGIRPEDMQRVMESFGQGRHDIRPTDERGTGLGLAIAKSLVQAHGGTIGIESAVGAGTTVTVIIPQISVEPAQGATAAA